MTTRLRLLPLAIGIVFMMLVFKAYEIGRDIKISSDGLSVKQSQAQSGDTEPLRLLEPIDTGADGSGVADKQTSAEAARASGRGFSGDSAMPQTAEGVRRGRPAGPSDDPLSGLQFAQAEFGGVTPPTGEGTRASSPESEGESSGNFEQLNRSDVLANIDEMSQQELEGLLQLQKRRAEIERRERELDHKTRLLQAAEQRVDEKIAELNNLKITIEGLLDQRDEEQAEKVASLVKIFETMKPKDAANIFNDLAMPVLLDVVDKMNERKLAPILGEMDPVRARNITEELMQRRELPVPRE